MSNLAIITVVYNNYTDFDDYFKSFNAQNNNNFHIFVADLSDKPQKYPFPSYVTVFNADNLGYAYGLNQGLERAIQDGYSKFVFMNNDTTVAKDFVQNALTAISKHPKSIIGGKIYYYPGYEYHKDRYSDSQRGNIIWYAGGKMLWDHALAAHVGVDEIDKGEWDAEVPTEFVTGCLMLFDDTLVKTAGKMDDSYFLYYEDTDWCQQSLRAGCQLWYDPKVVMWHKNAQSTGGSGSTLHVKMQRKNRLKFALRYAPLRTKLHVLWNYIIKKN